MALGAAGPGAHRQMIFSVRMARFPTPSRSLRLSWSANHTSERSGVRSHAVSPSLFRSSGLAPRDRNSLARDGESVSAWGPGRGRRGLAGAAGGSQHAVVVALPGCDVQGCVTVVVDGMEVTAGIQQDLGDGGTAGEGGPVQADVLFLWRQGEESPAKQTRTQPPLCSGPPPSPANERSLTLSVRVTSAPRVSSMRITSMCLCSAAQMMGVHPPLSYGRVAEYEGDLAPLTKALLVKYRNGNPSSTPLSEPQFPRL